VAGKALRVHVARFDEAGPVDVPRRRHSHASLVLRPAGADLVEGSAYFLVQDAAPTVAGDGPPAIASSGVYTDTIVRVDGTWRYRRRQVDYDQP
jgi:hypothetical protein